MAKRQKRFEKRITCPHCKAKFEVTGYRQRKGDPPPPAEWTETVEIQLLLPGVELATISEIKTRKEKEAEGLERKGAKGKMKNVETVGKAATAAKKKGKKP